MHMTQNSKSNRLVVPGAQNAIDQMKYEIANEFGVNLGPDTTARANGSVGGEITKRLVQMGQEQMSRSSYNQSK
nr:MULTISPECIES: alpha/beta-type small acid-soluble spore protein [Coprobacillaceae]